MTDNNNINYRAEGGDKEPQSRGGSEPSIIGDNNKSSVTAKFEQDLERDRDIERDRDCRGSSGGGSIGIGGGGCGGSVGGVDRRGGDEHTILDLKDFKERERDRELSTTPVEHTSSKRKRKNSSFNCDNSLTSTHSAIVQERNYSQDSQVSQRSKKLLILVTESLKLDKTLALYDVI